MIYCILATGPSLSQSDIDYVRGKCKVIAVSDAYKLAPWCDYLVSADYAWWNVNKDAAKLKCKKFCNFMYPDSAGIAVNLGFEPGLNSGLIAMKLAINIGAKKIVFLGLDMKDPSNHFFGAHKEPLSSTSNERLSVFINQFNQEKIPEGVDVVNCTSGSGLKAYRFGNIYSEII